MHLETACKDEPQPKFLFGRIVATPNALNNIPNEEILGALSCHISGDWGSMGSEDWNANERAINEGGRLFSVYHSRQGIKFWIITEADRSKTTILLPEDY
jgi:hypothetical protein